MKKLLYICLLFLLCSYNCLYCAYYNNFVDAYGLRWELEADRVEGSKYNNQSNWPTNPSVVFKYTAGTSSQTIIYFNMSITDYSYINPTGPLVTDIVIPSYVNWDSNGSLGVGTGPLQIIESNAFYNKPVTSVDIPLSILTIKLPCFNNCGNLKSIKIDGKDNFTPSFSSQSNYSTLNGVLFNSDKTQLKKYPEGKNDKLFKVPQTVSKLDDGCFANTKNLAIQFFGAAPEIHENAFVNSTAVVYYPKGAEGWPDFDGGGYFDEWGVMAYPIGEQDYVTEDGVILRFHKESSSVTIDNVIYIPHESCTIPSTIGGYPVTSIGDFAFSGWSGLTLVTIPDSVTSIGDYAFLYCDGFTSITIPDSVTSIGDRAFEYCSGLTSITIPDSVTSIGEGAFSGCSGLTSITIPDSVTSIGDYAFSGCSSLTSITIPDSVTSIGYSAFEYCSGLTKFIVDSNNPIYKSVNGLLLTKDGETLIAGINGNVVIPQGVTSIGNSAFSGCSGLTSITIPNSVTSIGYSAFEYCSGLTSVTIPDSVTSIEGGAFFGCSGLTSITIPDSVTSIGYGAFSGCNSLLFDTTTIQGVKLFDGWVVGYTDSCPSVLDLTGIRGIGAWAFEYCSGLTSVTIPDSVTSIGEYAFYDCSSLTSVTIPNSVTSIGSSAFCNCSGLTSVTIPNSVTNIGDSAFKYCSGLTSITIPDSVTSIGYGAFSGCNSLLFDTTTIQGVKLFDGWVVGYTDSCPSVLDLTGIRGIADTAFSGCSGLTSITIPDSVTSIGDHAFSSCSGLTSITIPDSVTSIGRWAFNGCSGLTKFIVDSNNPIYKSVNGLLLTKDGKILIAGINGNVVIPQGVTSIGEYAFFQRSGLTSVTIPQGVTSIGEYAFYGCSVLTSVTIGDSVTSIGEGSFSWCYDLKSAIFLGDAPRDVGGYPFEGCADDFVIKVKKGTKGWNVDPNSTALPATWHGYTIEYDTNDDEIPFGYINFDPNGGEGSMFSQPLYDGVSQSLQENTFTRVGYTFAGWSKTPTGAVAYKDQQIANSIVTLEGSTITLYAVWEAKTYTIKFYSNGGDGTMVDQAFVYDIEQSLSANTFTREGYKFVGWSTSENGAVVYADKVSVKNLTAEVNGVVELYAVWEEVTVPNPVINPPNGSKFAGDSCIVTISCELDGAIIYYSSNGVTPRLTDACRYKGPFVITNTSTIKTIAVFNGIKSDYVAAVITKDDITLPEVVGAEELVFTTGGDADWHQIVDASSPSGYSVESGEIGCESTTWMKTTASGEGIFSFKWKVDCEHDDSGSFSWDRATVYTNDIKVACIDGTSTEWEGVSIVFNDDGEHTIMWEFCKDDYDEEDADYLDAAWVTGVTWTPLTSIDPIPEISDASEIAKALDGSADSRLAENITSLAEYNLFREWATSLPNTTLDEVKASSTAWMSFALDQSKLIANEPVEGDVSIASLDAVAADGSFEFTVNIDKIDVGDRASEENLKKLFKIEGATSLGNDANFSSENVEIELAEPVNGDVKFKILPKDSPDSFFIRAKLLK